MTLPRGRGSEGFRWWAGLRRAGARRQAGGLPHLVSRSSLLVLPGFGYSYRDFSYAAYYGYSFGYADCSSCVQRVEEVAALQYVVVGCQEREARFFLRVRVEA